MPARRFLFGLLGGLVILPPGPGAAHSDHKTLYVAMTGSDAGECRDAKAPCRTIDRALALAGKGDTIKVDTRTGQYVERVSKW